MCFNKIIRKENHTILSNKRLYVKCGHLRNLADFKVLRDNWKSGDDNDAFSRQCPKDGARPSSRHQLTLSMGFSQKNTERKMTRKQGCRVVGVNLHGRSRDWGENSLCAEWGQAGSALGVSCWGVCSKNNY